MDSSPFDYEREKYNRAFYHVKFRVPKDWNHVGLFPVEIKDDDDELGERKWMYPYEPGYEGETWVGWTELVLAMERGWRVDVVERMILRTSGKGPDGKSTPSPMDTWSARLLRGTDEVDVMAERGEISREVAALCKAAFRGIFLHGIGSFNRKTRMRWKITFDKRDLPEDGTYLRYGDGWRYLMFDDLSDWSEKHRHPEFSHQIWSKGRKNILYKEVRRGRPSQVIAEYGALTVPKEQLVGCRTDAWYLTCNPGWLDDGEVGRFRLKGYLDYEVEQPSSGPKGRNQLLALRDRSVEYMQKKGVR
jgi:hypothetical protein